MNATTGPKLMNFRVTEDFADTIHRTAAGRGVSTSEALREAVAQWIANPPPEPTT